MQRVVLVGHDGTPKFALRQHAQVLLHRVGDAVIIDDATVVHAQDAVSRLGDVSVMRHHCNGRFLTIVQLSQQFKQLTLPEHMGERFQAMAFARDVDLDAAFLLGDLGWRL